MRRSSLCVTTLMAALFHRPRFYDCPRTMMMMMARSFGSAAPFGRRTQTIGGSRWLFVTTTYHLIDFWGFATLFTLFPQSALSFGRSYAADAAAFCYIGGSIPATRGCKIRRKNNQISNRRRKSLPAKGASRRSRFLFFETSDGQKQIGAPPTGQCL